MIDGGVCRTALDTPSLYKIIIKKIILNPKKNHQLLCYLWRLSLGPELFNPPDLKALQRTEDEQNSLGIMLDYRNPLKVNDLLLIRHLWRQTAIRLLRCVPMYLHIFLKFFIFYQYSLKMVYKFIYPSGCFSISQTKKLDRVGSFDNRHHCPLRH